MLNLYVASTAKKSGKTFISSGLAGTMQSLGYSTAVYKPIQTNGLMRKGFVQSPDLTFVKTIDPYINTYFSYLYSGNNEPLTASELDNDPIDTEHIANEYKRISSLSECVILDGDCGLMSPIAPDTMTIDLIKKLQIPMLIVTEPDGNAVNNALMTIHLAQDKGIDVRGVVINKIRDDSPKKLLTSIPRIIEEYTNVKVLGLVSYLGEVFSPEDLITVILNGIDIESVFDVKIEKLDY